jgi:beta-1,4-mannosyl-glycoprotein beta-1,4-N-acetylglucosaminyltransferase
MTSTKSSINSDPRITIVTVFTAGKNWHPECVYRMRDMIDRTLSIPYRFVCITDHALPGIDTLPLKKYRSKCGFWNLWYKPQMFRPEFGLTGPCLYIDLDMLVVSDIADIIYQCRGYDFLMTRDPFKDDLSCSALMYWEGDHSDIWQLFRSRPLQYWVERYQHAPDRARGVEQAFVSDHKPHQFIQDVIDSTLRTDRIRKHVNTSTASILFCSGARKPWHPMMLERHPDVRTYWLGKPMIIDTTLFNNEFDMLDIRLALTQDWVDHWIICEGNRTMSGQPKPYHLSDNIDRYDKYKDRMTVLKLDIPEWWTNWDIENGQRAHLLKGYDRLASQDDIIIHSDLDEILNPDLVPDIVSMLTAEDKPITCGLDMYLYRFDQKLERGWKGHVVARRRHFQDPCTLYKGPEAGVGHAQKKKIRRHCVSFPVRAGWHWGWMGNDEIIRTKVASCIESQHRDAQEIVDLLAKGDTQSAINQKCRTTFDPDPGYPARVLDVIKQYPWWTDHGQD